VQQAVVITFWLAMALYAGATVLYAYYFVDKRRSLSIAATFLTGAGFLMNSASIAMRSLLTHGTELAGPNSLVLAAWALVLVYFFVEHVVRLKVYGAVLVPVSAVLLVIAQILGVNTVTTVMLTAAQRQQLSNWTVALHVGIIMLANAGFAVGAAASAVYLVQENQLKRHKANNLLRRLPSLAQTDNIARRSIAIAFPAYSAGLLLGVTRAIETVGATWWLDPRVMLSGIVWVVFALYLFFRYGRGVTGRHAAWIAIVGLVFVVILSVVARTVASGFHVFGLGG
jgi:ABC-type transport system involved in cytochrome c biogenesis permease subunit